MRLEFGVSDGGLRVLEPLLTHKAENNKTEKFNIDRALAFPSGELIPSLMDHQPVKRNGTLKGVITPMEDAGLGRRCCQILGGGMPTLNDFRYGSIKGKNFGPWREHKEGK